MDHGKDPMKCWCHNEQFPKVLPNAGVCICIDCVKELKTKELKEEIVEAEKQFMLDALKSGGKGWAKHFFEDGVMVSASKNPNIVGRGNIEETMTKAFDGDFKLSWAPDLIEFSDDYSLCYSSGRYERSMNGELSYGKYLTIWKRIDEEWFVKLDIGN